LIIFGEAINPGGLAYAILFLCLFVVGLEAKLPRIPPYLWLVISLITISILGKIWLTIWILLVIPIALYLNTKGLKVFKIVLVGISLLLPLIPAFSGIIPILNPNTRFDPLSILYVLSGYGIALLNSISPNVVITLYGTALGILSMYRSVIALSILPLIYRDKIPWKIIGIGIVGIAIISVARGIGVSEILYRPAFTYRVYERLYEIGVPFGKLFILKEAIPGYKVGQLFGSPNRYTYTIFGESVADFGIFGVLEGFLLGLSIREARKEKWVHTFGLTILSLGIEVGLDTFKLATLFLLPFIGGSKSENKGH